MFDSRGAHQILNMKKLIQDTGGFQLYAELRHIEALGNTQHELKFITLWADSKNPEEEMVKSQFILTEQGLNNLWDVLNGNQ